MTRLNKRSISEELPELLSQKGMSVAALAGKVGVSRAHLSRALRAADGKRISADLAGRIALALGRQVDYFPEYREGKAIEALRSDPALRDRVYRLVSGKDRGAS